MVAKNPLLTVDPHRFFRCLASWEKTALENLINRSRTFASKLVCRTLVQLWGPTFILKGGNPMSNFYQSNQLLLILAHTHEPLASLFTLPSASTALEHERAKRRGTLVGPSRGRRHWLRGLFVSKWIKGARWSRSAWSRKKFRVLSGFL